MDPADLAVDADELRRLAECAAEPIRTPGLVQSHGTLLGVDPQTAVVVVASENAREWLGRPIAEAGNPALEYAARTGNAVDSRGTASGRTERGQGSVGNQLVGFHKWRRSKLKP